MNRIKMLAMLAMSAIGTCVPMSAQDTAIIAQTLFADGSTNTWTQSDLIAALQLMNRKYHRDVSTTEGRRAWHGRLLSQSVDTNALIRVDTYEDGMVFTNAFNLRTPAANVAAANARLKTTLVKGVPKGLAEARLRRQSEIGTTNIVTVTITK